MSYSEFLDFLIDSQFKEPTVHSNAYVDKEEFNQFAAGMKELLGALTRGVWLTASLIIAAAAVVCYLLLGGVDGIVWWRIWLAPLVITGETTW